MATEKIMKAGIAIEYWKLPIFQRHLEQGGFKFTQAKPIVEGVLILTVETNSPATLAAVVDAANREASDQGKPQ